jgi:hypothetical protein
MARLPQKENNTKITCFIVILSIKCFVILLMDTKGILQIKIFVIRLEKQGFIWQRKCKIKIEITCNRKTLGNFLLKTRSKRRGVYCIWVFLCEN